MLCEMTGCYDAAEYCADFEQDEHETKETHFEICESCADYWREHKEERPTITRHKNKERENAK